MPVSTLLSIVLGLIDLAKLIASSLHDRKLISLGQAQAVADAMTKAATEVSRANRAADEADAKAGGDPARVDPAIFERDK